MIGKPAGRLNQFLKAEAGFQIRSCSAGEPPARHPQQIKR